MISLFFSEAGPLVSELNSGIRVTACDIDHNHSVHRSISTSVFLMSTECLVITGQIHRILYVVTVSLTTVIARSMFFNLAAGRLRLSIKLG